MKATVWVVSLLTVLMFISPATGHPTDAFLGFSSGGTEVVWSGKPPVVCLMDRCRGERITICPMKRLACDRNALRPHLMDPWRR